MKIGTSRLALGAFTALLAAIPLAAQAYPVLSNEGWMASPSSSPGELVGPDSYALFQNNTNLTQTRRVEHWFVNADGPRACTIRPDFTDTCCDGDANCSSGSSCGAGDGKYRRHCIVPDGEARPRCFRAYGETTSIEGAVERRLLNLAPQASTGMMISAGPDYGGPPYGDIRTLATLAAGASCYDNPDGSAANCPGCLDAPNDPSRCARVLSGPPFTPSAQLSPFIDVGNEAIYRHAVASIYGASVTEGCGANPSRYCPGHEVTRLQMAKLMLRAMHGPVYAPPSPPARTFDDLPDPSWAA